MIYEDLQAIADKFDIFIFDAYGVFWEGNGFYTGSREIMTDLLKQDKIIAVVSNSSALSEDLRISYKKRGLINSEHYTYLISSGDLLLYHLKKGDISFASCQNPLKYYVIGKPHSKAFNGTKYQQVKTLHEADFVYIGVPYVYKDTIEKYPQLINDFWPTRLDESGNVCEWDTLTSEPFNEIVAQAARLNLPILNANPDFTAKEGHKLVPDSEAVFVVRNGMIAQMFRHNGAEVLEYGKPHRNIYDFVFAKLQADGININKNRTCMIGDTVRTDIKGAINAGITPILCLETGVTAEAVRNGQSAESLCIAEKIDVKKIIQIKSVGGK